MDQLTIERLKSLCRFDYEMEDDFCIKISVYDINHMYENTIRHNKDKNLIISLELFYRNKI